MKANGKGSLAGLYDRLTPAERFRLSVEAESRGDEEDARRLVDTCPRRQYRMNEVAFTGRWDTARQITLAFSLDLGQHLSRLQTIQAVKETCSCFRVPFVNEVHMAYMDGHEAGSRYAWSRAGMEGDPPGWKCEELPDGGLKVDEEEEDPGLGEALDALTQRLEEADIAPRLLEGVERDLAEAALPLWRAYCAFCEEELQVDPRKMLTTTLEPILDGVDRLETLAGELGLQPEEETWREYRDTLSELWAKRQGEP